MKFINLLMSMILIIVLVSCQEEPLNEDLVDVPVEVPNDPVEPVDDPTVPNEPNDPEVIVYTLSWDFTEPITCNIHKLNLTNETSTIVGFSNNGIMENQSNLKKIFYIEENNTIVGLHKDKNIWKLNLSTNNDTIIPLNTENMVDEPYFTDLHVKNSNGYILYWDKTFPFKYDIKRIDLNTGDFFHLGESSSINFKFDLNEIYYDENLIFGLHDRKNIWKFNPSNGNDTLIDLSENHYYKDLYVKNGNGYLLYWDNTFPVVYEVKKVNLTTGELLDLGNSSSNIIESQFNLNEIYYDENSNIIISLFDNKDIWVLDLLINEDYLIDLDNNFYNDLYKY